MRSRWTRHLLRLGLAAILSVLSARAVSAQAPPAAFGKLTPTNNATGQATTVLFEWQSSSGATTYQYCLDTSLNSTCNSTWTDLGSAIAAVSNPLAAGTTYEWQVRAQNTGGTTLANGGTWWRFTTRVMPAGTYFLDDLETAGALGWGRLGTWAVTTEAAFSPTHAWSDSPTGTIPDQPNTITSPGINLTGAIRPVLTFWHRHAFALNDSGRVRITANGVTTDVATYTGSNPGAKVAIDLTAYIGSQNLMVVFDVVNNSAQPGDGWYVDDIRVAESGFTNDPLISRATTVRRTHITELRDRIDALRGRYQLPLFSWTNPLVPNATVIQAQHIIELRTALLEVYPRTPLQAPTFTDPVLVPRSTTIRAAHIQELRNAVIAIE